MNLTSAKNTALAVFSGRVLLGTALVGTSAVAALLVVRPEQWLVEHVVFDGLRHATAAEARHLADLPNGTAVWEVDPARVAQAVERHPWIRSAEVRLEWPDTVRVTVDEHVPVALLHTPDGLVYVDEEGEPFLEARADDLDHPHLTGFGPGLDRLHPDLSRIAVRDALRLLVALDDRGLVPRDRVSEIAFDRRSGFTVFAGPARLAFGPSDLGLQTDRLASLVASGLSLDASTFVDLAPATVAIVRPLPGGPPASIVPPPPGTPPGVDAAPSDGG